MGENKKDKFRLSPRDFCQGVVACLLSLRLCDSPPPTLALSAFVPAQLSIVHFGQTEQRVLIVPALVFATAPLSCSRPTLSAFVHTQCKSPDPFGTRKLNHCRPY